MKRYFGGESFFSHSLSVIRFSAIYEPAYWNAGTDTCETSFSRSYFSRFLKGGGSFNCVRFGWVKVPMKKASRNLVSGSGEERPFFLAK